MRSSFQIFFIPQVASFLRVFIGATAVAAACVIVTKVTEIVAGITFVAVGVVGAAAAVLVRACKRFVFF